MENTACSVGRRTGVYLALCYKEGNIPSTYQKYQVLRVREKNRKEEGGCYDYIEEIDYCGENVNVMEYEEKERELLISDKLKRYEKECEKNGETWKIENEVLICKKARALSGTSVSHDYQRMKNHYYLNQTGHMIKQILEK